MSNDERQIYVIMEYLDNIPEPESTYPPGLFHDYSYSRWAVGEILVRVLATPDKTPMYVVKEFERTVAEFSHKASSDYNKSDIAEIFDIAWREAIAISDILYAMS